MKGKVPVKVAIKEISRLLEIALKTDDEVLMRESVKNAIALSRKLRVRIPRKYAIHICRKCGSVLRLKSEARFRARKGRARKLVIKCRVCGSFKRIHYG